MGMFDTVHATGHSIIPNGSYQTKDLNCDLDHYELREDGAISRTGTMDDDITPPEPWQGTGAVWLYGPDHKRRSYVLMYVRGKQIHAEYFAGGL
jgi:hypothetical protein